MTGTIGDTGMKTINRLMAVNLGLAALQPISAGFFLSGFNHALAAHIVVAVALQLVAAIQCVTAIVLWLRRRVSPHVAGLCVGLLVTVLLEVWAGRHMKFWLHVPLGVAIFAGLRGRMDK
jgi:predicted DNA repair protein MutK